MTDRPTAYRIDMRVSGQDNPCLSNMPRCRSCTGLGVNDLHPWSLFDGSGDAVGELLFQRADKAAPPAALLLKLLFTSEPLSIRSS
jgi:hypothetical protein